MNLSTEKFYKGFANFYKICSKRLLNKPNTIVH